MKFRPQFWPTLLSVPMLIILLALGTWQANRYTWKADLIEKLNTRSEAEAIDLSAVLAAPDDMEFRRVRVTGTYLHDREIHLIARSMRGNPGIHVMTPLRRADGKGTELINRGWVPPERSKPTARAGGQIEGEVTVEGIVRLAKGQGRFIPDNDAAKNVWFFIDHVAMAAAARVDSLPSHYIVSAVEDVEGDFPVGKQWRIDLPNNHFEYALTWYLLAVSLVAVYIVYHRKRD